MSLVFVGESPTARGEDLPLERPLAIADLQTRHEPARTETRLMKCSSESKTNGSATISRPSPTLPARPLHEV